MPQTQSEIRTLFYEAGLRPQKQLGQNFLIDGNLMTKLVNAAELEKTDVVLEVGAGTGSLTEMLLSRAGWVVAVEVDRGLYGLLTERLGARPNLALIHSDVLESKSAISPEVISALKEAVESAGSSSGSPRVMLVANLPYHVASPLLVDLLLCEVPFARYCFSVQREVADRITAEPDTREYGPLSIALQACSRIRKVAHIPPQAFWPSPQVESTVLRLDIDTSRFAARRELRHFVELVRLGFAHRRKKVQYSLRERYREEVLIPACAVIGIDLSARAETISIDQWHALSERLHNARTA